jgi:ribonuclease R
LGGGDSPTASDYAELLPKIKARPDAVLLQTMLLRSMQQAVYSPDNIGHFGLSYEAYAHFTSPIRRYPDLLTHRAIKAILQGKRYEPKGIEAGVLNTMLSPAARKLQAKDRAEGKKKAEGELAIWEALGIHCSANERRADEASRDVEAWLKCYFIRDKLGEEFTGTISGVTPFGIFVQLDSLFIEGLVHVTELGADYFQFDDARHELRGERTGIRYQLTDRVTVQVSRVDLDARKIDLRLVSEPSIKTMLKNEARRADSEQARAPKEREKPSPKSAKAGKATKAKRAKPSTATAVKARSKTNSKSGKKKR